jgi:nucleotide-binding universal stress UspA family protein
VHVSANDHHWIAAGVDGSPDAERALQWAVGEAKLRNAAVRILTAWQVPVIAYTPHGASPPAGTSLEDRIREAAEGVAEAAAQRVREEADLPVETRVVEGKPADVLIEQSRGADLLVLGSRPKGALSGLLTSSVTVQCAIQAPAPTAIVR